MSRVLPCPKCGDHMWDNQATCDACKPTNSSNSIYILESKIDSLQEKLDTAISELRKCQNELQKYELTKDRND